MKLPILLMSLIGLMLFSCKKTVCENFAGTWKMIAVTDNTTNVSITKPSSIQKDVIITFVPNSTTTGSFSGKTPSNDIDQNPYTLGAKQAISIPVLSMTKVAETSWGSEFVDHIRGEQQYSFETGAKLKIRAINKTLTFQKL